MKYNSLVQLGLIVISIVIIFTYIQPTFADIREIQNELFEFKNAVEKANEFNSRLGELNAVANSISSQDMARLNKLLPAEVDTAQVMRDIEVLVERTDLALVAMEADEYFVPSVPEDVEETELELSLAYQDFTFEVVGSYEDAKQLLSDMEGNDYILEVMGLEFGPAVEATDPIDGTTRVVNNSDFRLEATVRAYAQNRGNLNVTE